MKLIVTVTGLIWLFAATQSVSTQDDSDDRHGHEVVSSDATDHAVEETEHEHAGHEGHEDEALVSLTPEAMRMAGIVTARVSRGAIEHRVILSGEVGFDEDRLVHVTPRFAGIALRALPRVGDIVGVGDLMAVVESNESLTPYEIRSPMAGRVIQRHITTGEFVSEENSIYVIADLSRVWVNLAVYPKDADLIRAGLQVEIESVGSETRASGVIEYVTPIMDIHTRSITARVVLSNPAGAWRPGTFVRASVAAGDGAVGLVVDKHAVQVLDGEQVVFVEKKPGGFLPVPVETGESDAEHVLIRHGLEAGAKYVRQGAFDLKARIITSAMDPHAGHGH